MSKDLLSEATRALRETEAASELEVRSTRARALAGLHQTRVRRRTRVVFLLPIAATFVAVTAWGSSNGNARHALQAISHWFSPPPAPAPATDGQASRSSQTRDRPPAAAFTAVPLGTTDLPASDAPTAALTPTSTAPLAPPRAPSSASAAALKASDPTLDLYRAAHTAHFVDHDPVRALAGWDAYLAAAPNGPFAPEARYNRALSLVRLGRTSEAQRALAPFADGTFGGYRKAEASALLERLSE